MPRYDYECQTCHHRFELKQSFSSEPVAACPVCQSASRRLIHSVPVVFKGSGFYVNDYGKGNSSSGSRTESKEPKAEKESKTESKAESGSDSKAESKSSDTETKKESAPTKK